MIRIFLEYLSSFGSKTAKLDEESTLKISGKLPRLDGATALYPVYAAFAEAVYPENEFSEGDVICTNTINAYDGIISGERDIIFVADFFAVTSGEPQGNSKLLIDWILSEQGQEIIEKTGYTPLLTSGGSAIY